MMMAFDRTNVSLAASRPGTTWRGRSGTLYALSALPLEGFALQPDTLTLVARGPLVMWVGTREDIVNDQSSRARFRLALDCADRVFRLVAPADPVARMTLVWDLEGGEPAGGLSSVKGF